MGGTKRILILAALPLIAIACGLPQSSEFEQISGDDVQFGLDQTTTTSTTTIPPTTIDATSTTIAQTTTTEIPTELVELYFVAGSQLNPVSQPLSSPVVPQRALSALQEGPPSDIGLGLRTTVPANADITVVRERGTAVIDLPADIFDTMPLRDQRLFFAQLVLTIGQLGGIGPVQFTLAGEPTSAIRGDGSTGEPGEAVTVDDYLGLLAGAPQTTTSTTSTTSTVPVPPTTEVAPGTSVGG
jgi:spore germination protein GerM